MEKFVEQNRRMFEQRRQQLADKEKKEELAEKAREAEKRRLAREKRLEEERLAVEEAKKYAELQALIKKQAEELEIQRRALEMLELEIATGHHIERTPNKSQPIEVSKLFSNFLSSKTQNRRRKSAGSKFRQTISI